MLRAVDLKTEYLKNPMGLITTHPRFYWKREGTGKHQLAYQIQVVSADGGKGWDSGKVDSASCTHIRFEGQELASREQLRWRVRLWDETGEEGPWSQEATFEMGLLEKDDWMGWWITGDREPSNKRHAADCFCREFRVMNMPQRARLYASALGVYEVYLNGRKVGDSRLMPGWTDTRKRVGCTTWDVLPYLQSGTNKLELVLGDGWHYPGYGKETRILAQLEMTDLLGDRITLGTERSFRWSDDGATGLNNISTGETGDCGKVPSYKGKARICECYLTPQLIPAPPIREQYRLKPAAIATPDGETVLDFGENVSAVVEFHGRGEAGQVLCLRFSEYLEDDGSFPKKLRKKGCPSLTLHLTGNEDAYTQRLSYACFRYALVENIGDVSPEAFTASVISSDLGYTSTFTTSDTRLNKLVDNARRSMQSAFLDAPIACPGTNPRAVSADALAFFHSSAYLAENAAPFWRKWLRDTADAQRDSGCFSLCAPTGGEDKSVFYEGTPARSGAAVLLAWQLWKFYGDRQALTRHYSSLRQYAFFLMRKVFRVTPWAYITKNPEADYTMDTLPGRCELLEPEEENPEGAAAEVRLHTEEATAWMCYVMTAMEDIARELGNGPDSRLFREYAKGAKDAYRWLYYRRLPFRKRRPGRALLPLTLGLLPEAADKAAFEELEKALKKRGYRACTGAYTTPLLLPELTHRGRSDLAYKLLLNKKEPGWLSQIENGATSIWENWYGKDVQGRHSGAKSRYVLGSVVQWLFQDCAGIRPAGENRFEICPHPGGHLTQVFCSYESLYGTVSVEWQTLYGGWSFEVTIPVGTTAKLSLPDGSIHELTGGKHFFGI